jgi:hypothetical protein
MADLGNTSGLFASRTVGALSGAAISLIYMLPKSEREAVCRFLAGLVSGVIFGGPVGVWLAVRMSIIDALSPSEIVLSGAAAVSLCSWWALGLLERLAKRWGRLSGG